MNADQIRRLAVEQVRAKNPAIESSDPDLFVELVLDLIADWQTEDARERGEVGDAPALESCDVAGTGEGRFHGLI